MAGIAGFLVFDDMCLTIPRIHAPNELGRRCCAAVRHGLLKETGLPSARATGTPLNTRAHPPRTAIALLSPRTPTGEASHPQACRARQHRSWMTACGRMLCVRVKERRYGGAEKWNGVEREGKTKRLWRGWRGAGFLRRALFFDIVVRYGHGSWPPCGRIRPWPLSIAFPARLHCLYLVY